MPAAGDTEEPAPIRLTSDSLVVLAGPSASGKSTWAAEWFRGGQVVSSDELRAVVGEHVHDLRASADAFEVLDAVVERRLRRGLLTVVDTLGMDPERHERWLAMAQAHGRPSHLVCFDADAATCRRRNKARTDAVPPKVLSAQLDKWDEVRAELGPAFDQVHAAAPVRIVPPQLSAAGPDSQQQLRFGLLVSAFDWPGDTIDIADRLAVIATEAEHAGFDSLWVMDHFMQIPQVGREWDPMLESYTTLAYLAGRTTRISLGALVSCITHRNIAHLGKIVATLDVLSNGRARCGLGVGWFEREHGAYGYEFPPLARRYELLEDALEFLPLLWGSGAPAFQGRTFATAEAIGYPRPVQADIPILVGGSGEKRTLRLAARYADACNLFGEPEVLAHKIEVLHDHCRDVGRDPADIEVTQLSNVLVAPTAAELRARVDALRGSTQTAEQFIDRRLAATVDEHVDRFGRMAAVGVETVIVSLADVGLQGSVANFAPLIDHFRP